MFTVYRSLKYLLVYVWMMSIEGKNKGKGVAVLAVMGKTCRTTLILNVGTRCRRVVNITPRPPYPGKEPVYLLNRRLGGSDAVNWQHQLTGLAYSCYILYKMICRYTADYK